MLIVGGSFETGKPSGYVSKLAAIAVRECFGEVKVRNGGAWEDLVEYALEAASHDVVVWMPDVSNDRPKLASDIKNRAPHALLVTSKRNDGGKYSFGDLVARALKTRSGLLLEISREEFKETARYRTTIMDPLGNVYASKEPSIEKVAEVLLDRVSNLRNGTRVSSQCMGELCAVKLPQETEAFFEIVRSHANTFHELIHGANPTRMMGNASFRCTHGFPTFRHGDFMFVSKRDIDKRDIGAAGFVPVNLESEHRIEYWGPSKPSVDSPINLHLYNQLPRIRYMLHSHTYVQGAPFTSEVLACGDLREAAAVLDLVSDQASVFHVNLRGHGSLVGAEHPDLLRLVRYVARPVPELQL